MILKSHSHVQQQQHQFAKPSSGKPGKRDWDAATSHRESPQDDDRVEITTSVSNKIDLRIDGIALKEILQDEEQMKDISDVIQKFEQSKVDLGEGHNKKEDYVLHEGSSRNDS